MSMTKWLAKQLRTMTPAEVLAERDRLLRLQQTERNSCVRSSIWERIGMCDTHLKRLAA